MTHDNEKARVRSRASRACQTCSQRKVRCDATEVGLPCSRCRVDKSPNCILVASRRGTYPRRPSGVTSPYERNIPFSSSDGGFGRANYNNSGGQKSGSSRSSTEDPASKANGEATFAASRSEDKSNRESRTDISSMPVEMMSFDRNDWSTNRTHAGSQTPNVPPAKIDSLTSMFEKFLDQQAQTQPEDAATKCGIIFMSGNSPLTFALEELQRGNVAALHDAGSHFPKDDSTTVLEQNKHPPHTTPHDINYLKVKGAFDYPKSETLSAMVLAFVDRFCPLYSIVDVPDFQRSYESKNLPWILLHAVCFIGATYCDLSVIHRAGFKSRWHARRLFYDKAKVLFDIGYETNKIILLQTVLMLSFWGPQMKSYWNPCSWVGFGVTIAESLGIHRLDTSADMDKKRKSLLKRLFWTLEIRDAYCATLLGRPFRLNVAQCDTEYLTLDDFDHAEGCNGQTHERCQLHAHYQIQVSKLSLILRTIVETRFGRGQDSPSAADLHTTLEWWQSELPSAVNWCQQGAPTDIFAVSLKIIFHLHLVLIHLEKPSEVASAVQGSSSPSSRIAESAAQMISSTAFTVITNSMLGQMPHEIFSGFFVAGIVFYRGIRQPDNIVAHLSRSALDNCQMVISEARERWDPAQWVMRIFDFLLSGTPTSNTPAGMDWRKSTLGDTTSAGMSGVPGLDENDVFLPDNDILHSVDFESPTGGMGTKVNDFFLMSNYLSMQNPDSSFMLI